MSALPEELSDFAATVREFARSRIEPHAAGVDQEQRFSPELWAAVCELGIPGLTLPAEYGGAGAGLLALAVALEEIARFSAVAGLYPGTSLQAATCVHLHGTAEQAARIIPPIARGEHLVSWAFTEPDTGSDPKQITTRATRVAGGWSISGQKLFISYAGHAQRALVFARTEPDRLGAFYVDTDQPGWQVGSAPKVLSFGGTEASDVALDGLFCPDEDLIGPPDAGFEVMLAGEQQGKIRTAALCVGIAQRALDEAVAYAGSRLHRGVPIGEKFPTVRATLGEMGAGVFAARAAVTDAAAMFDAGAEIGPIAAASRLVAARMAREVTGLGLQVAGAYGLTREMPLERLYREAKFYEVGQGVAELQKVIIGGQLLRDARRGRS